MSRVIKSSYINLQEESAVNISNYVYLGESDEDYNEVDDSSLINQHHINRANEEARAIIEEAEEKAKLEAEKIIKNAMQQAEVEKQEVFEKSRKLGYQDGLDSSKEEIAKRHKEIDQKIQELEVLRDKTLIDLEKEIVNFILDLTQKVLTKSFEINPDIISFLVQKGLTQVKNFQNLKIYVSEGQYEYVEANKNDILGIDTSNYQIQIIKDTTISDTECLIETDFGTINCSLLEQFDGLKNTLKYMIK